MKLVIRYIKSFFKGEFAKNVATLLTGATIAQIIPLLVAPILSRIFTPAEFGALAVYVSVVQILGSIAAGRYEFALVLPEKAHEAKHIFILGLLLVTLTSVLSLLTLLIFKDKIVVLFNIEQITRWLYFIPISTFLLGFYNLLNYYNTRLKNYKTIAKSTVAKSSSRSGVQLGAGIFGVGTVGLIYGEIAAMVFGNYSLSKKVYNETRTIRTDKKEILAVAKRYKRFPLFSMWGVLLGTLSQNISNFFITALYSINQTGLYSHAYRYLTLPINLMGNSVSQVFLQQASEAKRLKGNAIQEYLAVVKKLLLIGIPSFTILYFIVEELFAWYFGEDWRMAGQYAKILLPFLFFRFIAFPLSSLNIAFEKQLLGLYIQILLFVITVGVFVYVKWMDLPIVDYLIFHSASLSIFYLIVLVTMYFVASGKLKQRYF